jgi:hypothetical protein
MIFLHYVLYLVQILLRKLIAVFEDVLNLVVNSIEGVEVFLLEMPLLGLVSQQRNLVCDFLVVLHRYLDPAIVKVEQLEQLEGNFAVFAFITWRDVLIFAVSAYFLFLEVTVRRHRVDHRGSLHFVSPHPRHLLLLVFLLLHVLLGVLVVEPDRLVVSVIIGIVQRLPLLGSLLLRVGLDMLHDLRKDLLLHLIGIIWRETKRGHKFPRKLSGGYFIFIEVPVEFVLDDGIVINGNVEVQRHQFFVISQPS